MSSIVASPWVKQILITSRPSYFAAATQARPDASTRPAVVRTSRAPGGGSTHKTASDESFAILHPRAESVSRRRSVRSTERSIGGADPSQPAAARGRYKQTTAEGLD